MYPVSVHVTATNPLRARRHPNLVTRAIVSDHGAYRVAAVTEVVAWKRRIIPARVPDAIMNGIMPVVIVIGVLTIPTAIMRLKRVMRPANASIGAGYDNILSGKTQRPYLGGMRVIDPGSIVAGRWRCGGASSTTPVEENDSGCVDCLLSAPRPAAPLMPRQPVVFLSQGLR